MNPHAVTEQFEAALADYCGATYAVATTSCTMALLLALSHERQSRAWIGFPLRIPRRTYVGVAASAKHAGWNIEWTDEDWLGSYTIDPVSVVDSARHLTMDMYRPGTLTCLSFHWSKTLAIGQGGAILCDSESVLRWLQAARFDGRTPGANPVTDVITICGYHAYMAPRDAAEGLSRLAVLPRDNAPLPCDDYPDLSMMPAFQ